MRHFISTLFLAGLLSLCAQADPVVTLIPAGGSVSGSPGSTVGWGVTLTVPSAENDYIVLTGSSFAFTGPSYGTYTDYLSNEFIAAGRGMPGSQTTAFDATQDTGAGQFTIDNTAPFTNIAGDLTIHYDGYSDNTFSTQTIFDQTVTLPATISIVPEPVSFSLFAIALVAGLVTRRHVFRTI
ncbi:MAG: hypothetical protein ACRD4O_05400 [Bryobacteraceae bacterium]